MKKRERRSLEEIMDVEIRKLDRFLKKNHPEELSDYGQGENAVDVAIRLLKREKSAGSQTRKLADFILAEFPGEPGKNGTSESAVEVAIRLLKENKRSGKPQKVEVHTDGRKIWVNAESCLLRICGLEFLDKTGLKSSPAIFGKWDGMIDVTIRDKSGFKRLEKRLSLKK